MEKSLLTKLIEWMQRNFVIVLMFCLFSFFIFMTAYSTRFVPNTQYVYMNETTGLKRIVPTIMEIEGMQLIETIRLYSDTDNVPKGNFPNWAALLFVIFFGVYTKILLDRGREPEPLEFQECLDKLREFWSSQGYTQYGTLDLSTFTGKLQKRQIAQSKPTPFKWWIQGVVRWRDYRGEEMLIFGLEPFTGKIESVNQLFYFLDFSKFNCPMCGHYFDFKVIDETMFKVMRDLYGLQRRT